MSQSEKFRAFLFGKFDDYSYQRRDLSPSEGYMFERMLVEMKNHIILPLFINFALFWAQPFGYLNDYFCRFGGDERVNRFIESMRGQYVLEPKDWLEMLAHVPINPTEEGYNDFKLTEEEQERNRWLMIKGIGLPEWHQWLIKICENNSESEALKVKIVGYEKGEEYIGMGWAYADLDSSDWLSSIASTTFDEEEYKTALRKVTQDQINQIKNQIKKLYPDEKGIPSLPYVDAFFHANRLMKSFESESRTDHLKWDFDGRLEHLVLFMNKNDADLIKFIVEPRHQDRIVWIGELLDKVIVNSERKDLAKTKWNQIRDFLIENKNPFELISNIESLMPIFGLALYYKGTFERFIARDITDESSIKSQKFIGKAVEALISACGNLSEKRYDSCERECHSAVEYILKASAVNDGILDEGKRIDFGELLDLVSRKGQLFKGTKDWPYEKCKTLKRDVSSIWRPRSSQQHDNRKAKEHNALFRLNVVDDLMEKYGRAYRKKGQGK